MGLLELTDLRHTLLCIGGYNRLPGRTLPINLMQLCQVLFHTKYQVKRWKGPFFARSQDRKQDT